MSNNLEKSSTIHDSSDPENVNSLKERILQKPIQKQTVVAQVMERVKELIASGSYQPGDRLPTEQELAELFHVGRSSIREALKVFHHLGVVESKAGKGTFIRERANISLEAVTWALILGDDDQSDVYELSEAIKLISFRRLSENLEKKVPGAVEAVEKLHRVIDEMDAIAETGDPDRMIKADFLFHEYIIRAGGNKLFLDMYHTLQAFMSNESKPTDKTNNALKQVVEDHARMLEALVHLPPDEAVQRYWKHHDCR